MLPGRQTGSACFLWLCLLLLSGPALQPGIAASRNYPAEGKNGSTKPNVTVYRCKDCDSTICQSSNYESFEKIGETQNGTLSNDIIQLVNNETHIIMCFQQEIKYLNEVYAIIWEKDLGIGESCGNVELGDSPTDPGSSNRIGITAAFLILGVCAAAALVLYCVQRTRNGQGPVIVLYQILKGSIKPNQAYESRRSQPFEASSTNETNQAFMPAASFSSKV
ncbi:uncharacterized protein LOC118255594 isoform X3 [Cygnus atratus]|uniref:uncharacterized protein LOC118255594 isoform X3 n=1 Tax=Cygnus atratus TaxID=8868 RepID=UPI0015D58446|nr:uncharacterized protein LOC118255594 isoform X3 [Cygnus atratus]